MIAFLTSYMDVRGGTQKQFLELLQYADAQGVPFKVFLYSVNYDKTFPEFRRFKDRVSLVKRIRIFDWLSQLRRMKSLLQDVDTINIHDPGFEKYFPAFRGKRVVYQVNDLPIAFREGADKDIGGALTFKGRLVNACYVQFCRLVTKLFVDVITVNVSKNAERVERRLGMPATVLYCGITPVNVAHDNACTKAAFAQRRIRLLSSGVLFPYRNYETLVSVVAQLREKGIQATLDIFGSNDKRPDYYQQVMALIAAKNLGEFITLHGNINEEQYLRFHRESDVFCFVNVDQSWGLAVFEAMSAGLPVVVSNSVGATELLTDNENAIYVDPLDVDQIVRKIEKLMLNSCEYERLQANALALVDKYSWEKAYCRPMLGLLK